MAPDSKRQNLKMAEIPVTSPTVKVRTLASGLAFPEGPIAMADGSIMVTEKIAAGTLTRIKPDGGVERIAELGGGPNGAAIEPDGAVNVCNNSGNSSDGWVCQATLIDGGIVQISPDGEPIETLPLSDPMVTNICFGGPDHRTAFITCSGTGHLVAVDWPRPGGRLAFPQE